jgi:hypothetical protein
MSRSPCRKKLGLKVARTFIPLSASENSDDNSWSTDDTHALILGAFSILSIIVIGQRNEMAIQSSLLLTYHFLALGEIEFIGEGGYARSIDMSHR